MVNLSDLYIRKQWLIQGITVSWLVSAGLRIARTLKYCTATSARWRVWGSWVGCSCWRNYPSTKTTWPIWKVSKVRAWPFRVFQPQRAKLLLEQNLLHRAHSRLQKPRVPLDRSLFPNPGFNSLKSLEPVESLVKLKHLSFSRNKIDSLRGIENLASLKSIDFSTHVIRRATPTSASSTCWTSAPTWKSWCAPIPKLRQYLTCRSSASTTWISVLTYLCRRVQWHHAVRPLQDILQLTVHPLRWQVPQPQKAYQPIVLPLAQIALRKLESQPGRVVVQPACPLPGALDPQHQ